MSSSSLLYFDYAATTPVDARVIAAMVDCLGAEGSFGNPASSSHLFGNEARSKVERARRQVAAAVGAKPEQIVWTSGATESNNLALKGVAQARQAGGHLITSAIEHKAILDTAAQLEASGVEVTYLQPDATGAITEAAVRAALRDDTFLVSLMLVNNEIGTVTDIERIGRAVRAHGALLHVDAAQAVGKIAIDLSTWAVDLMSLSAHKSYGPKGIGALYVGESAAGRVAAQIHGGGHEGGLRSGTLATHQIVGMGAAFELAAQAQAGEFERIAQLRQRLLDRLEPCRLIENASAAPKIPHIVSLRAERAFDLSSALAVSSTSACNSASEVPSHVLIALGLAPHEALQTVRLSIGRYTTAEQIDAAAALIQAALPPGLSFPPR